MFVSFPAMVSQRVALGSLVSSLRNNAFSDKDVSSIAKLEADRLPYFQGVCKVFVIFSTP